MGHLPTIRWIKVQYNQNTLTGIEFQILHYLTQKKVLIFFGNAKIIKAQVGFELGTYRSVVTTL